MYIAELYSVATVSKAADRGQPEHFALGPKGQARGI